MIAGYAIQLGKFTRNLASASSVSVMVQSKLTETERCNLFACSFRFVPVIKSKTFLRIFLCWKNALKCFEINKSAKVNAFLHTPHFPYSVYSTLRIPNSTFLIFHPTATECVATAHWRAAINPWLTAYCRHNAIGQERRCERRCDKRAWSLSHGTKVHVGQKFWISVMFNEV